MGTIHVRRLITSSFLFFGALGCGSSATEAPEPESLAPAITPPRPAIAIKHSTFDEDKGRFVVHEWGTFTAMQGFDGLALDGLAHETDALPSFVHDATPPAIPSPYRRWGDASLHIPVRHAHGKMETPVVYFYSDTPRKVSVRVDFAHGLLSEWFPRATEAPLIRSTGPIDIASFASSTLVWDAELTPFAAGAPVEMPTVDASEPWSFAREVRSSFVTVEGSGDHPTKEAEHYLFYRGLADFHLPLAASAQDDGSLQVISHLIEPIDDLFFLEMGEKQGRYRRVGARDAGGFYSVGASSEARPKDEVVRDLERDVAAMLVLHGLYADEARAMVRTWSPTWFASAGARLLYVMPKAELETILKLSITPAPDRLERVLVVRHELLTPARRLEIESALRDRKDGAKRDEAETRLARLGRFLEPAVRAIVEETHDPAIKESAAEVLKAYELR